MIRHGQSIRYDLHGPRPTWWQLYVIAALFVGVVGLVEVFVDGDGLRKVLESLAVIGGFGLVALWRRMNRIALDLGRHHL